MTLELAQSFLIALLIGALIGIDREKKKDAEPGHTAGIRTYILLALVGAAAAWISLELETPWVFVAALLAVSAAVIAGYISQNRAQDDAIGLTSEIAAIAVCLLGAMVVVGYPSLAVALAVVTSAVLAYKQPLHGLVGHIGSDDIFAGIKLLIASFIILPLLPDAAIDPWGAINPYKLWLLVIMIAALSLVGYVATRMLGKTRGTAITGLTGGLVSSTATTLNFARASRNEAEPADGHAVTAGVLLAWLIMFVRTAVLVAFINPAVLQTMWIPFAAMGGVTAAFAGWHYFAGTKLAAKRKPDAGKTPETAGMALRNPFSLGAAIQFGVVFAMVLLAVKFAQENAPGVGVYVVSALAGSVDVDAITLSIAESTNESTGQTHAATAISIAALANTAVKCAMVIVLGTGAARRQVAVATAAIFLAGGAWLWLKAMLP
ncbi:MgtC/SapB family protein [Noviherbaspirillum aerium]|uniref:MgtC/SapB family protein n=1 Tax=Noviherbaspirillum aerium TaxID=2588497 RepID=UPI00124DDE96|nr:MgtC/SapB family protein [Noviherbaspirillum aerium]